MRTLKRYAASFFVRRRSTFFVLIFDLDRVAASSASGGKRDCKTSALNRRAGLLSSDLLVARLKSPGMLSRQDNELITRVGPGTPMGNLMREYWIPALLSREVPTPDADPLRVLLLG